MKCFVRAITVIILCSCCAVSLAQRSVIDSLRQQLSIVKTDTEKVLTLNELSKNVRSQDLKAAYQYATEARELAITKGFTTGKLSAQLQQGLALYFEGKWDDALKIYIGSLEEAEKIHYKKFIPQALVDIGIIYEIQLHYGDAISIYNRALKLFTEQKDEKGMGTAYSNLGSCYYHTKNYIKALDYYEKAKVIVERTGSKRALSGLLNNIAGVYAERKEYKRSLEYYFRSLELKRSIHEKNGTAVTMGNIGDTYREMRDFANAVKYSTLAAQLSKEVGNNNLLKDSYLTLAQCGEAMGDFKTAYHFQNLYSDVKDSIYTSESAHSIAELETKFMSVEKDKELLVKDLKIKEQQGHARQQQIIVISLVAGLGLALVAIFFIFKSYRDKQKANRLIAAQKELVEEKQKAILDSIHYAKRIQTALLTSEKYIARNLEKLNHK